MSSKQSEQPLYKQKNVSLVARAMEEFNKVTSKQEEVSKANESNTHSASINEMEMRKGANPGKRRTALGRGLSALMSSTTAQTLVNTSKEQTENQSNQVVTNNPPLNLSSRVIEVELGSTNLRVVPQDITKEENAAAPEPTTQSAYAQSSTLQTSSLQTQHPAPPATGLQMLPIDRLSPNPKQPRKEFLAKEIRELASSIRKSGLIQPILVRKTGASPLSHSLQNYEIVAGERRWRAAREAGLIEVPALIKSLTDRETLELGIIENIQRQDLNPLEEALAYKSLIDDFGASQEEIASAVGKDRSSIANSIRLLSLSSDIQTMLSEKKISAGHARAILTVEDKNDARKKFADELLEEKLSVREAEKRASERKKKIDPKEGVLDNASLAEEAADSTTLNNDLEERLRRALGTKVKVLMSASGKGEVKISFFSRPEFEAFLDRVGA